MSKTATKQAYRATVAAARKALALIGAGLGNAVGRAAQALAGRRGKIVTTGIGKSGFIAAKVAATMTSLGVPAVFLHPTDAMHGDIGLVSRDDAVIAFSHSGNTKELLGALYHLKRLGVPVVAVTGGRTSRLAAAAEHVLAYRIAGEGSPHDLAPMASTTVSLVIGDMLAAQLATLRGFTRQTFAQLHPSGTLGLQLTAVADVMLTGKGLPTVSRNASFHSALRHINDKKLGIVAVIDEGRRLVGALTDGDVRRFVLSGASVDRARVQQAMTARPRTIALDATLLDALRAMEERKITSLFVVDSHKHLKGMVHMHQIIERQLA